MPSDVLDLFLELAAIPSPPGEERAVADRVARVPHATRARVGRGRLRAPPIGSTMGNIFAACPDAASGGTPIFLCAHLDTVPPDGGRSSRWSRTASSATPAATILGARQQGRGRRDARGGAADRRGEHGRTRASSSLFTPKEEVGLLGAAAFDDTRLEAQLGFVYDQAAPIGEIVIGAPSARALEVRFHGRAAHAGSIRRRAVRRSRLRRARSPTFGSAGSTTRRPRTSA